MKKIIIVISSLAFLSLCGCGQRNVSMQPSNSVDASQYYDNLLCRGEEYMLVAKMEETVTDVIEYIGVLNDNYEWIVPLSNDTPVNPGGELVSHYSKFDDKCNELQRYINYKGDGVFSYTNPYGEAAGHEFLIVSTNTWVNVGRFSCSFQTFQDGYLITSEDTYRANHNHVKIIKSSGDIIETEILCYGSTYLGAYSEGLFFAYDGFYDIDCKKIINLSKYAGRIKNHPYFSGGICELIAENENGTKFVATIDNTGNFISEFTKAN